MTQPQNFTAQCPICDQTVAFEAQDDFWHCRDGLTSSACPLGGCSTRERALASALSSLIPKDKLKTSAIHETAPVTWGLSLWLRRHCRGYVPSGYFPTEPFGTLVNGIRNENLERQTFADGAFDIVLHLDVMEHLFDPFQALREIRRTLKPNGFCLFTAPTDADRMTSEQVAFLEGEDVRIVGEPEYHGNPQGEGSGSLVTWRYGYDLPLLIQRRAGFDVETRRYQSRRVAAMGYMTEVYILRPGAG